MNRLRGIMLAVLVVAIALAQPLLLASNAGAESAALSITPRKDYAVEPGKTRTDTLSIRNLDRENTLNLTLRVVDFSFIDDGGAPKLMMAEDAPQTTWSLKPFLKIPKTVTIEPNTSQTLDLEVSIPEGHGAGSYYSAIVYSSGAPDGGNVGLNASGVTLVFTEIPGEVKQDLVLDKLGAYNPGLNEYHYINTKRPERIGYTLINKGNVAESPVGSITLKPLFGDEITISNINPNKSLALIGQTRTFSPCILLKKEEVDFNGSRTEATACAEPRFWPGYYTVEMNAFYGRNGNNTHEITGTASFWYLPWWFILVSLVVLAFIGYHVWKFVRYVRNKRGGVKLKKRTTRRR